jgi:transposase-like protein
MIAIIKNCPRCGSKEPVSNSHDVKNGKQKYYCKSCGKYGTLAAAPYYSEQQKSDIMKAYFERPSMSGIARTFGAARQTLADWLLEEGDKHQDQTPKEVRKPLFQMCPLGRTYSNTTNCSTLSKKSCKR